METKESKYNTWNYEADIQYNINLLLLLISEKNMSKGVGVKIL